MISPVVIPDPRAVILDSALFRPLIRWSNIPRYDPVISSFSPEATTSSASKPKETSVLGSKNIHEKTRTWGFPHTSERTSCFWQRVTNIRALLLWRVESWVRIKNVMGYVSIADRRTLISIWSQTIAELSAICDHMETSLNLIGLWTFEQLGPGLSVMFFQLHASILFKERRPVRRLWKETIAQSIKTHRM